MKLTTLLLLCLGFASFTRAAEAKKEDTFLDEKSAGPDFVIQGEYVGFFGENKDKVGAQIIAMGDAKFHGVWYPGGLPGDGWDGEKKIEADGTMDGDKALFRSNEDSGMARVGEGTITGKTHDGLEFTMAKVIRKSPTLGARPPAGAIVLFDGSNGDAWVNGHIDERHLMAAGSKTKQSFQDYTLHVEFLLPFKPTGRGQGRANSGVYMQDRYEVQVLDSFGLKGLNNECGGIYSQVAPSVNMCFPPLSWQTYDIDFQAARYNAEGAKKQNAIITVKHNGVTIHDHQEIKGPTGGGKKEDSSGGAIQLQGHGNPVYFQNIWIVEKK